MSPDPIVQAPTNSQSWNRYTYTFNSPLSFTDPSGYCAIPEEGFCGHFGDVFGDPNPSSAPDSFGALTGGRGNNDATEIAEGSDVVQGVGCIHM